MFAEKFPSFKDAVNQEIENGLHDFQNSIEPSFVKRGLYVLQLKQYFHYFKKKNLLFLEQRELLDTVNIMKKISTFLDIECSVGNHHNISNKGSYEEILNEDITTLNYLKELYHPYNEELFNLIDKRYDWNDA